MNKLIQVTGPAYGGLGVEYDNSLPGQTIEVREMNERNKDFVERQQKQRSSPKPKRKTKQQRYLDELINSGITLNEDETRLVEENIFKHSQQITRYQLDSLMVVGKRGSGWKDL